MCCSCRSRRVLDLGAMVWRERERECVCVCEEDFYIVRNHLRPRLLREE